MGGSGSSPSSGRARPFGSPFPDENRTVRKPGHILVVEDNPADLFLIREAIENAVTGVEIHIVRDGLAALGFLDAADGSEACPCPGLVILDINLPKKSGNEVLRHIRQNSNCSGIPVLIVSTSGSTTDQERMRSLGCDGYFRKPSEYADFMKLGELVKAMLGGGS